MPWPGRQVKGSTSFVQNSEKNKGRLPKGGVKEAKKTVAGKIETDHL